MKYWVKTMNTLCIGRLDGLTDGEFILFDY